MDSNGTWQRNEKNPYVRDPFYFKKHPGVGGISTSGTLFSWNYNLSGSTGAFFNLILLYLICFRTPGYLKPYGHMLLLCCCADAFYLLVHAVCHTRIKMNDGTIMFVNDGIAGYLPYNLQAVAVCCLCGGMTTCCTVLPAQFYYRYVLLTKNITLSLKQTLLLGFISLLGSMFLVILAIPSYINSGLSQPNLDYGTLWYSEVPVPVLVITNTRSHLAFIYLAYATALCSTAYILTIYLSWKTMKNMDEQKHLEFGLSEKTQRLQREFNRVLVVQAMIPLFTAVLPIFIGCTTTLLRLDTGHLGSFLIIILSWLPVLNSAATLLLLPPYRKLLIRFLTSGAFVLENKIEVSMINTSLDSIKHYRPWDRYIDQRQAIEDAFNRNFKSWIMDSNSVF